MKNILCALGILFIACVPIYAQTGVTGTWRVDGVGQPYPWEVVLRADGQRLGGAVDSCFSNPGTIEIFDGKIDENRIAFKCTSKDGRLTISFTGKVNGDEIAFSWALQTDGPRDPRVDGMFGSSAPPQFMARRVPDETLAKAFDDLGSMGGMEFAAAVNLVSQDLKAQAELFIPLKVRRVRALLVVLNYGLGDDLAALPQWSQLSEALDAATLLVRFSPISPRKQPAGINATYDNSRSEALLTLLQRLAQETGHQELSDAPMLFWGHSGAAYAAGTFASRFPDRTLAFVRYHYGDSPETDLNVVSKIPALLFSGGKESNTYNVVGTESLSKRGRAVGAPWTFVVEPDATHGDPQDLKKAIDLMVSWITAVVRQRLSSQGATLRPITDGSAWMGNNKTGEVVPYSNFTALKTEASWLPDEASARAWQRLRAMGK